ncbi:hypothetical protein JCM18750_36880 [Halostagnicola bangensis]
MIAFSVEFYWIAAFAIVAAVVNSAGIVAIFRHREWAERSLPSLMCFAAGILITTPLIHTLPHAIANNAAAEFTALFGFLFMYLSNEMIKR